MTRDSPVSLWLSSNTTYRYTNEDESMAGFIQALDCGGQEPLRLPPNGYLFVQMEEHTWSIGILNDVGVNRFTSTVFSSLVDAPSYPFRLHVDVTSGTLQKFRLGVGVMFGDGTMTNNVTEIVDALLPIRRAAISDGSMWTGRACTITSDARCDLLLLSKLSDANAVIYSTRTVIVIIT